MDVDYATIPPASLPVAEALMADTATATAASSTVIPLAVAVTSAAAVTATTAATATAAAAAANFPPGAAAAAVVATAAAAAPQPLAIVDCANPGTAVQLSLQQINDVRIEWGPSVTQVVMFGAHSRLPIDTDAWCIWLTTSHNDPRNFIPGPQVLLH